MSRKGDEPGLFLITKAVDAHQQQAAEEEAERSKAIIEDPFEVDYDTDFVVKPPVNLLELASMWEKNTILGQCYETMETNIEGFGYDFIPRFPKEKVNEQIQLRMEEEKRILTNFFNYASVNDPKLSFTDLRKRKRREQESVGNAWWEVVRGRATNELMGFNCVDAHTVRFCVLDEEPVQTEQKIYFFGANNEVEEKTRTVSRQFRKILQRRSQKKVWFKEYGDPRVINAETGEVDETGTLPPEKRANEILHFGCVWTPRTPYHMPRTIGNLFSIYGSRSAEEINYTTFENNMIPSAAICCSNGMLTQGSISRLKQFTENNIVKRKNYSTFLLLESEPIGEGVSNPGTMRLDIKPLTNVQHKDELFQEYDKNNCNKVRGCFRMPPIYLGAVQGYNKSTAVVSRHLADEQVFAPLRDEFDSFMNRVILPELGVMYWTFRTNTPNTTDNETMIRMLGYAEKTGGMSPRISSEVLSQVLGKTVEVPKGIDPDVPYSYQLAKVMQTGADPNASLNTPGVNAADRAMPAEPVPVEKNRDDLSKVKFLLEKMYRQTYLEWHEEHFPTEESDDE